MQLSKLTREVATITSADFCRIRNGYYLALEMSFGTSVQCVYVPLNRIDRLTRLLARHKPELMADECLFLPEPFVGLKLRCIYDTEDRFVWGSRVIALADPETPENPNDFVIISDEKWHTIQMN